MHIRHTSQRAGIAGWHSRHRRRLPGAGQYRRVGDPLEVRAFFHDRPRALELYHVLEAVVDRFGPTQRAATKSRVSFIRRTRFLWVHEAGLKAIWIGFNLPHDIDSPRLRSGRRAGGWSHHVKISSAADMDEELVGWLGEAYRIDAP